MRHPVRIEQRGDIAVIVIECPPVETLSVGIRRSIRSNFEAALADEATRVIILCAQDRGLPQSADLREVGQGDSDPSLADLCNQIEAASKPVVAALQGPVLNAGLELSMAAHYRVASHRSIFGLTDIRLGLTPSAGGSQRLPRLVGADAALSMMLAGKPIAGGDAVKLGLVDALTDKPIFEAACFFAQEDLPLRRTSQRRKHLIDTTAYLRATQVHTAKVADYYFPSPAANAVLKIVEAAVLMPFEAGLAMEARCFKDCFEGPESRGLRHAAFAERVAPYFPELKDTTPTEINAVGIVGGGHIGTQIASVCMDAGLPVILLERNKESSKKALDRIAAHYRNAIAKRRISEEQAATALRFVSLVQRPDDLSHCDLIIDALPEDVTLKSRALKQIGQVVQPSAVIATTTALYDIDMLATASGRAEQFLGLHVFPPADQMKLIELVVGRKSSAHAIATAHRFTRRVKRMPVRVGPQAGFIVGRIQTRMRRAADMALLEGAKPWQVDAAMRIFGFLRGPYQVMDRMGLGLARAEMGRLKPGPGQVETSLLERMCNAGFTGQEAQVGFYIYTGKGARGKPNHDVLTLIELEREERGIAPKKLLQDEISDRLHLAMIDEAARVLEDGTALRASDIDAAVIHGMGYPRLRGGPLFQADEMGTFQLLQRLDALAAECPGFGAPAKLVQNLARERAIFAKVGST